MKRKYKGTNLDEVPKTKDERLVTANVDNLRHVQLCQDEYGKSFKSSNTLFGMLGSHACLHQVSDYV